MKRIPLSATFRPPRAYALVDDEDYERFGHLAWSVSRTYGLAYANRQHEGRSVLLHRVIMGCEYGDGKIVDHRNGDGLDNRRSNLRVTTIAGNLRNQRTVRGVSQYRGVTFDPRSGRWQARACVDYRRIHLGMFDDEGAAGAAVEAFWREFDPTALEAAA